MDVIEEKARINSVWERGKEVKHELIERNMTQAELVEIIDTSRQYLGKILCGDRAGTMYLESIDQVLFHGKFNEKH